MQIIYYFDRQLRSPALNQSVNFLIVLYDNVLFVRYLTLIFNRLYAYFTHVLLPTTRTIAV